MEQFVNWGAGRERLGAFLVFLQVRGSALLQHVADNLLPKDSLAGAERDARRRVQSEYREFFVLLERAYNLIVRFNLHFHDRPLRSLSARERATLLLFGRVANGLRRTEEDALSGYGPDACGHATSLFEFCWTVAYLSGDEATAAAWLRRERLSEGMDVRTAITGYLARRSIPARQFATEYEVYRRLNAFKHASPVWLSFHGHEDWEALGTLRMGPDLSRHGAWALCFALEMGSQLVLLALVEAATQLLPSPAREQYVRAADGVNQERLRLHALLEARWGEPEVLT